MKSTVTISRHWNNPKINKTVTVDGIALSIDMDDFVTALKEEIGSVTTTFTKKTFETKLDKAVYSTIEKIKEESKKADL
jgi:hypothetical protein